MRSTTADLVQEVETNLIGFFPSLNPTLARVGREDAVVWCTSDLDHPVFNGALGTGPLRRPSATVPRVLATLEEHGRSFLWWVTPASRSDELTKTLDGSGLSALPPAPAMAADLASLEPAPTDGLTVQAVSDAALVDAMRVVVSAFEMAPSLARGTAELMATCDPRVATVTVLGAWEPSGCLVGSGTLVEVDGTAGLYNIATMASARGRGVGRAVTLALMHLARDRGHRHVVLEASEMGQSLYESLGFRTVCEVQQWLGQPGT
jgi:ribosomal protein S18 acetylase RimI-like enzyme